MVRFPRHTIAAVALTLFVLILPACTRSVAIDGEIDCETDFPWSEEGTVPEGTPGFATADQAVEEYLAPFQANHGGDQQMIDEFTGSLVLEQREVVVAVATEASGGGWLVLTAFGCEDFDRR